MGKMRSRRAVQRAPTLATDIYVSRKSNFKSLVARGHKLIGGKDFQNLTIHGLGNAIPRAIHVALRLKEKNPGIIDWVVNTKTVPVVDDVQETDGSITPEKRVSSAITIKIHKIL